MPSKSRYAVIKSSATYLKIDDGQLTAGNLGSISKKSEYAVFDGLGLLIIMVIFSCLRFRFVPSKPARIVSGPIQRLFIHTIRKTIRVAVCYRFATATQTVTHTRTRTYAYPLQTLGGGRGCNRLHETEL